jgi:hypothetical protein
MTDLIARLEAASGPSRELDEAIARHLGAPLDRHESGDFWRLTEPWAGWSHHYPMPKFTASIDNALTLVPEGWSRQVGDSENRMHAQAVLGRSYPTNRNVYVEARTMPIALCIAALRARSAS